MAKLSYLLCVLAFTLSLTRVSHAARQKVMVTKANIERFLQLPREQRGAPRWCRLLRMDLQAGPIVQPGQIVTRRARRWFIPYKAKAARKLMSSCRLAFLDRVTTPPVTVTPEPPRCAAPQNAVPLRSEDDLFRIDDPNGSYVLMNDITFTRPWRARFTSSEFVGVFEGCHYTLHNLMIEDHDSLAVGLFGMLGRGASVKNMIIQNSQLISDSAFGAGILAGLSEGSIENVHIRGGVVHAAAPWLGALIGFHKGTAPLNSSASSVVNGANGEALQLVGRSQP